MPLGATLPRSRSLCVLSRHVLGPAAPRCAGCAEARRHVRAMKNLEEFVGADKDTGLLSFFRALLTIDPRKRINAEKGLTKSFVRQKKKKKPEQKVGSTRGAAEAAAGGAAADATGAAADGNDS